MTTAYNNQTGETLTLAPRETMYLRAMANGYSVKEVAKAHGVSPNTVAGALKRIYYKLNAHRVAEAVYKASKAGMLGFMMALTVISLVQDEPYNRAPRNRPRPPQSRLVRGNRSSRANRNGDLTMLASLMTTLGTLKKPENKPRNQFREKTFAWFMDPPATNADRLRTYAMKRARVNRAARNGSPIPEFPIIVFRA